MAIITDKKRIDEVLSRGVHDVFTKEELKKKLMSGKQLHVKLGTDVTGSLLHLGHSVIHRKIRDFQELGHKVTLIIGDFTTLVGDHSDKVDMRGETNLKEIKNNEKGWSDQFFKTVYKKSTTIRHNSEWLKKCNFNDIIFFAKQFTLSQMLDRETFMLRYKAGKPIGLDELMYPLMQGYDSVVLKSDIELGGTEQTFNLLAGRKLMEAFGLKPQSAMVMRLLTGSDGRPMGKSLKNFIPISSTYDEMYGGIMSIVDDVIFDYFELITRIPMEKIIEMKKDVKNGENPMKFKKILAKEIVSFYHGDKKAEEAERNWENVFSKKEIPEDIEEIFCSVGEQLSEALVKSKILSSKGEWRRLVEGHAVHDLIKKENVYDQNIKITNNLTLKIGKKRFVKIILK
jgi:tyrosyl-tRNA synthetase